MGSVVTMLQLLSLNFEVVDCVAPRTFQGGQDSIDLDEGWNGSFPMDCAVWLDSHGCQGPFESHGQLFIL
eukprot:2266677-Pyramimonas_sp.AAC.2